MTLQHLLYPDFTRSQCSGEGSSTNRLSTSNALLVRGQRALPSASPVIWDCSAVRRDPERVAADARHSARLARAPVPIGQGPYPDQSPLRPHRDALARYPSSVWASPVGHQGFTQLLAQQLQMRRVVEIRERDSAAGKNQSRNRAIEDRLVKSVNLVVGTPSTQLTAVAIVPPEVKIAVSLPPSARSIASVTRRSRPRDNRAMTPFPANRGNRVTPRH